MREKLEAKKKLMENMSMHSSLAKEDANKQEKQLSGEVRSLLVAGTALSVARKRLQVIFSFVVVKIASIITGFSWRLINLQSYIQVTTLQFSSSLNWLSLVT